MKIGLAQIKCLPAHVSANVEKISHYTHMAKGQNCDVVIFPEMSDTGYDPNNLATTASTWTDAKTPLQTIRTFAKGEKIHIICGLSEKEGNSLYNALAIINSQGRLIAKYRKIHLFAIPPAYEDRRFSPGDSPTTTTISDMRWGFAICYDLRFPEMFRSLIDQNVEVITICSAWPQARIHHWRSLCLARAIENQAYVLAVNRTGKDGKLTFGGQSLLINPAGNIMNEASENDEGLITASIDRETVTKLRREFPVLNHRKSFKP